ncbi:MAG: hypothetical protein VKJ05_08195 [Synechococcaceae cyanobacterium]|nr:hypothetical protein [Synechococcaceae cyanobacterium]
MSRPEPHHRAEPPRAEALEISAHCLLRLMTALLLESEGLVPLPPAASLLLNAQTAREHSAGEWIAILAPAYQRRFGRIPTTALLP